MTSNRIVQGCLIFEGLGKPDCKSGRGWGGRCGGNGGNSDSCCDPCADQRQLKVAILLRIENGVTHIEIPQFCAQVIGNFDQIRISGFPDGPLTRLSEPFCAEINGQRVLLRIAFGNQARTQMHIALGGQNQGFRDGDGLLFRGRTIVFMHERAQCIDEIDPYKCGGKKRYKGSSYY